MSRSPRTSSHVVVLEFGIVYHSAHAGTTPETVDAGGGTGALILALA